MKVSPKLKTSHGRILVHASSTAYRMKKIDGGITFSKRDSYKKEDLLEPIDISKGYTVQPFEHLVIETVESFELSDNRGILFWDNLTKLVFDNNGGRYKPKNRPGRFIPNLGLIHLIDGWIDPGYNGVFSRQPKWLTGRTIYPGDAIGYGQVFFFPTGVNRSYGSASLDSQYKDKTETAFAR